MSSLRSVTFSLVLIVLGGLFSVSRTSGATSDSPPNSPAVPHPETKTADARLYVFRPIRSFGAHIDDYITVNGVPAHRLTPGTGFYCDVPAGDYVIGVARHDSNRLSLSLTAGQARYVCVMLHDQGGVALRSGALTSDQSFDVRSLDPAYGAERVREYHLFQAHCQP